jgi:acyl carrier protein
MRTEPVQILRTPDLSSRIRRIVAEYGCLAIASEDLTDQADLYAAGMTSHAGVNVLVALESELDCEFPDSMLKRGVFGSIASIRDAIEKLARTSEVPGIAGRIYGIPSPSRPGVY